MTKTPIFAAATAVVVTLMAGSLSAKPSLRDVPEIREGLITAGIAYEISEVCPSVSARIFRGLSYLNALKDHARGLGYTEGEISAFVDNRDDQRALEALARERLANMGAVAGQPETYCVVGRSQMASGTQIGRLLY